MGKKANGEGSIYEHKRYGKKVGYRGAYTVYTAEGPKRRYVSGKTREEVRQKLTEAMAKRDKGFVYDDENLTVGGYLDRWLSDSVRGTVRESTYSRDKYLATNHVKPALGQLKLKNLNALHLQGLYRDRLDSGLSSSTVQKVHHVLHKALAQAVRWNLIPRSPADSVKAPTPTPKEMHPLSSHGARRLLEAARGDRLEALYALAIHTGMRRGELLGLKWEDVDLDSSTLQVRRSLDVDGTFKAPKNGKGRTLKLTPRALDALRAHKVRQNAERLEAGSRWQDNNLVFPNTVGKPMNAGNLYRREFQPLLKRAGLADEGFTIHSLRHTFATTLAAKGVHPSTAQKMLGHSDIRMTLVIYTHATDGMQDAATAALEEAFS